ncbi:hypothetical protein GIB67_036274 [Kingdonia uniflora]|uniref:Malectin-like domain-containing protein n=1 Tax=Kingdonia uniflora TaxID=39325 RepID=A0A7J7L3S2_9MAGN|nr:hypothetical protein GIB67_036274 [Kingdonia uniflora]
MSFFSLFFFFFSLPILTTLSSPYPYDTSYRIDCGGQRNFTNTFNESWIGDTFYSGGVMGLVAEPHRFTQQQERTLRFFPISSGKKNCYILRVPNGRYYIRVFTIYDNYDGELHSPSFDVSVEGTVVFSWRSPWPEDVSRDGAYSDLFAGVSDGEADICFYSIATDPPVIGSLEVIEVDPLSYDSTVIGEEFLLVNYGRLTCGSGNQGSGFSNDSDKFGRAWQSDSGFRVVDTSDSSFRVLSTRRNIVSTDQRPNYFPMHLYQTAVTARKGLEYELVVDAKLDYLLWFHFAEINEVVNKAGQRVFDVFINQRNVGRIDIFKQVGSFAALNWHYTVRNLSSTVLSVKLVPVVGPPLICGLENYALVPKDMSTVPDQVIAMRALKESLRVPDRMGWNGDPCAPSSWDAWEGVTCHPKKDKSALVVSQIDLGSQGLKGYVSEQINLLSNLVSLNLTSNSLEGTLPLGLGQKTLVRFYVRFWYQSVMKSIQGLLAENQRTNKEVWGRFVEKSQTLETPPLEIDEGLCYGRGENMGLMKDSHRGYFSTPVVGRGRGKEVDNGGDRKSAPSQELPRQPTIGSSGPRLKTGITNTNPVPYAPNHVLKYKDSGDFEAAQWSMTPWSLEKGLHDYL